MKRTAIAALTVAAWLALAPAARADGDPASDILTQQDVFYGSYIDLRTKAAAQLPALLEQSRSQGYEIKVALITAFEDLGVVTFLWKQPEPYADYLGAELSMVYKQRVLVVMPNGYGIYWLGHSGVREQRLLERLGSPRKASAMLPRAIDAVRRLAAAQGIELKVPDVKPPPGGITQPQSHFGVGAREQNPSDVPARPLPATAQTPVAPRSEASGASGLLYAAPALVGLLMVGVLMARRKTYSS